MPRFDASRTNAGSGAWIRTMTGQAASWTILSIRPSAWSELSPSPTSATSGRSRAVTGRRPRRRSLGRSPRGRARRRSARRGPAGPCARSRSAPAGARSPGSSVAPPNQASLARKEPAFRLPAGPLLGSPTARPTPRRPSLSSGSSTRPAYGPDRIAIGASARPTGASVVVPHGQHLIHLAGWAGRRSARQGWKRYLPSWLARPRFGDAGSAGEPRIEAPASGRSA